MKNLLQIAKPTFSSCKEENFLQFPNFTLPLCLRLFHQIMQFSEVYVEAFILVFVVGLNYGYYV